MATKTLIDRFNIRYALPASAVLLVIIFCISGSDSPGDFTNYYFGARLLTTGGFTTDIYETFRFNLTVHQLGMPVFVDYTAFPPLTAILYLPFACLPLMDAKLAWNLFSAGLLFFFLYRVNRTLYIRSFWLPVLLLVFFGTLRSNLYLGQQYILITVLLFEGYIAYSSGKKILRGSLWAMAILLKIFPAIILLYLLARRDLKSFAITLGCCAVLVLLSILLFIDAEVWTHYVLNIFPRIAGGEFNSTYFRNYQSMQVLLTTLFEADALHNPAPWIHAPLAAHILNTVYGILIASICIYATIDKTIDGLASFAAWIICSLMITGYGNMYSLILLMIPCVVILSGNYSVRSVTIVLLLLFAICNLRVQSFAAFPTLLAFPRLYLMMGFALIYFAAIRITIQWRNSLLVCCTVALLLFIFHRPQAPATYLFTQEKALLVYDYHIEGDSIRYRYIHQQPGLTDVKNSEKIMPLPFHVRSLTPYASNEKLQGHGWHIVKPVLMNDSILIYLSDRHRAAGFYTLHTRLLP